MSSLRIVLVAFVIACGSPAQIQCPPLLHSHVSSTGLLTLGHRVAAAGDFNGDGFADFAEASPFYTPPGGTVTLGRVQVYSGRDGSCVADIVGANTGSALDDYFGYELYSPGDLDGDGCDELIVGAPQRLAPLDPGYIRVYRGNRLGCGAPTPHWVEVVGPVQDSWFGFAISGAGDHDRDGVRDVVIGAPKEGNGAVRVLSGAYILAIGAGSQTPPPPYLLQDFGTIASSSHGLAVSGPLDCNNDGIDDFVVGTSNSVFAGGGTRSAVTVYSGELAPGVVTILGTVSGAIGARLGHAVCAAGDIDGDGHDDFVAVNPIQPGVASPGVALIYSGRDFTVLYTMNGIVSGVEKIVSAVAIGDLDGDGVQEIALGQASIQEATGTPGRVTIWTLPFTGPVCQIPGQGNDNLGYHVAYPGDLQNSGGGWLIAGAPTSSRGGAGRGGATFVYGFSQPYLGTGDDLTLRTGIWPNAATPVAIKNAVGRDRLMVLLDSPRGTFHGVPPILFGQLFATGTPPPSMGFPFVHLNPASPGFFLLFDGSALLPFPMALQPGGLSLGLYELPLPTLPYTVRLQAVVLSFGARGGFLATSNAHEIVVQ